MSGQSETVASSYVSRITEYVLYVLLWNTFFPEDYEHTQFGVFSKEEWAKIHGHIYSVIFTPDESPEGKEDAESWLKNNPGKCFNFNVTLKTTLRVDDIKYEVEALLECSIYLHGQEMEFNIDENCDGDKCRKHHYDEYDDNEYDDDEDDYYNYPSMDRWCTSCHPEPLDRSILEFAILIVHKGVDPDYAAYHEGRVGSYYMDHVKKYTITSQKKVE
jgi:hypothetical protein